MNIWPSNIFNCIICRILWAVILGTKDMCIYSDWLNCSLFVACFSLLHTVFIYYYYSSHKILKICVIYPQTFLQISLLPDSYLCNIYNIPCFLPVLFWHFFNLAFICWFRTFSWRNLVYFLQEVSLLCFEIIWNKLYVNNCYLVLRKEKRKNRLPFYCEKSFILGYAFCLFQWDF